VKAYAIILGGKIHSLLSRHSTMGVCLMATKFFWSLEKACGEGHEMAIRTRGKKTIKGKYWQD
jgi:hypothetical protein